MKKIKTKTIIEIIILLILLGVIGFFLYGVYVIGHLGDNLGI
jgi:hypothetical protein